MPKTMFDKIWDRHTVVGGGDGQSLLYISRHMVYDSSFHSFEFLKRRGLPVKRPDQTFATADHFVSTLGREISAIEDPESRHVVDLLHTNARDCGIPLIGLDDPRQGIIHVIGPELGIAQPGLLLVCADSHISTLGALGALAIGIGHAESTHVLATQTLWQNKPKLMRVTLAGTRPFGVTAKDIALAIVSTIGVSGASGHAIEFAGSTIRGLSMEERMTVCNMAIESGARVGMVAPDETTFAYLDDRPFAPRGTGRDRALAYWRTLPTDSDAGFDAEVSVDAGNIAPMVTWGITPGDALPINSTVPDPTAERDAESRTAMSQALEYMDLTPGARLTDIAIDRVFIGSCTNGRIEDLRAAAQVARCGRAVVPALVVPGSTPVKRQAEAEGLDRIFIDAGFEWRHSGCSLCVAINGDTCVPGERCASTSNRNYAHRQGRGVRTHLMSPAMAAAAALTGHLTDVRRLEGAGREC
ncbi:MAG: 3-isopropylmalate dehydratase large subunit [Rhodospirillales bacterium]|nr:3-isopropylmalate dehydratase large subunit [Rhodospirillales bacterium]